MYYYDFDGGRHKYPVYSGFLITINNPVEKGYTHDAIKPFLEQQPTLLYYCLADEIGEQGTFHTHIYVLFKPETTFSDIRSMFPRCHIDRCKGNSEQNRLYIMKSGKHKDSDKSLTSVADSFEEYGIIKPDMICRHFGIYDVVSLIKKGVSDEEMFHKREHLALFMEIPTLRKQLGIPNPVRR